MQKLENTTNPPMDDDRVLYGVSKVLFLDIDGVLNGQDNMYSRLELWRKNPDKFKTRDEFGDLFDERSVRWLQYIINKTDCKIVISSTWRRQDQLHPTQKPLELMKYLIKTYSNENDLVLDNTMGVGTTCLGAKELNRKFIGIEKEVKYYELAVGRVFCQHCH